MYRKLLAAGLLALAFLFVFTTITPTAAQGYPYAGRITGQYPDCNYSRVIGSVFDAQGNHVTEPVSIRVWQEGVNIPYHQKSNTTVTELTGASGYNFNISETMNYYNFVWSRPVYGTFYIAVVAKEWSISDMNEGLLSEPVQFTTEDSCDPNAKNVIRVDFHMGGTPVVTTEPVPASPNNAPPSTANGVLPVSADATCRAYTETAGANGQFRVCDDGQAQFLTTLNRYGIQNLGYPISRRYRQDGFVTQAFQKAILQWRPDTGTVAFVNVFDDLHNAGFDKRLKEIRQVPDQLPDGWDGVSDFRGIVVRRQGLLTSRPALAAAYFAAADPITFFGLPTSEISDQGNHYAIRLQRAVLQEWKEDVPWARAGQVTIANGGDIAKEMGNLPAAALVPEPR